MQSMYLHLKLLIKNTISYIINIKDMYNSLKENINNIYTGSLKLTLNTMEIREGTCHG